MLPTFQVLGFRYFFDAGIAVQAVALSVIGTSFMWLDYVGIKGLIGILRS